VHSAACLSCSEFEATKLHHSLFILPSPTSLQLWTSTAALAAAVSEGQQRCLTQQILGQHSFGQLNSACDPPAVAQAFAAAARACAAARFELPLAA